ncbi:adenylate/guanylate cyclase domain-containing protein [uncultured Fluviicola sp.]|uniref:adenylate/guanylate cyclase domain-containing protein n=1 Tax=uncultured Fluviicola sp. TaxID=463303 RepID=UPI0025E8AABB|nr:adenylate/guanylate cyclase domain-containing protein [uncultured Fluviicola sp.]
MITRILITCAIASAFPLLCPAQKQGEALIDSLQAELPMMKEDTNKVTMLGDIAFNYLYSDPEKSLKYANECLDLAIKLNWPKGIGKAQNTIGTYYKFESNYTAALKHYYKALNVFEKNHMMKEASILHMNIGTVYRPLEEYQMALDQYDKALKIARKNKDKKTEAQVLGNKGVIYFETKQFEKQQLVSLEALKLFRELGDRNNEAWILSNLGDGYAESKDFKNGIRAHETSINIYEELNNQAFKATSLLSLGQMYSELAKSEPETSESRKELLKKAIRNLKEAEDILDKLNDLDYLKEVYLAETNVYELLNNHSLALDAFKKYASIQRKLNKKETREQVADLEKKRETEVHRREVEIEQLKKRTEFIYLVGGIILLLVVIGFIVSNNLRQRKLNGLLTVEKQKSEDLLHNILPEEVASELKMKGSADAQLFNNVTVLFTDFVGFTTIAEQMSPKELVAEIDECFREFDRIMDKFGVEKIKTIGDAYMAAGGLPIENTTHAIDVLNAAIEIKNFINELAIKKEANGLVPFRIRIGIHSGPVVAGIVGVKKFAYDIWGDTVNTASRMESSGEEGKINISGETYELVKEHISCSYRGKIPAKNKGEIHMYFVEE